MSRKKKSNLAGFLGSNSRKNRSIYREFSGQTSRKRNWQWWLFSRQKFTASTCISLVFILHSTYCIRFSHDSQAFNVFLQFAVACL